MGTVWHAHDELLDRHVAVKEVLWPPYASEAEYENARRRALREAQMAARLRHANIVGIFDILEEENRPWIVMELLPYRSLRDIVRDDGPLPPARAAELGLGVLAGLRAAHAEGVVHRDVKPANILVAPDGRAILTDFGIARAADSPVITNSGMLVGSPSFTAPERARGGRGGPASDLWALGASLYMAVEGHPPFEKDSALASLTSVVADEPEPALNAGRLWPVISRLLVKDPSERLGPAEAEQMLRQVAGGSGPRHRRLGPWRRARQPAGSPAGQAAGAPAPVTREPSAEAPARPGAAGSPPAGRPPAEPEATGTDLPAWPGKREAAPLGATTPEPVAAPLAPAEPEAPEETAALRAAGPGPARPVPGPAEPGPPAVAPAAPGPIEPSPARPSPAGPGAPGPEPAGPEPVTVAPAATNLAAPEPAAPEPATATSAAASPAEPNPAELNRAKEPEPPSAPPAAAPAARTLAPGDRATREPADGRSPGDQDQGAPPAPTSPRPAAGDPAAPEPAAPESAGAELTAPEPAAPRSAGPEPPASTPVASGSAAPEPVTLEPAAPEAAAPEAAAPGLAIPDLAARPPVAPQPVGSHPLALPTAIPDETAPAATASGNTVPRRAEPGETPAAELASRAGRGPAAGSPVGAAPRGGRPRRRARRREAALAAAAVIIAAAGTAIALSLTGAPAHRAAAPPASVPASRQPSPAGTPGSATSQASASPSATASPGSGPRSSPTPSPSPTGSSPGSASAPAGGGYGTLPAGYYRFTNSTGFSIGVPESWTITHSGHYVYITDPANRNVYLLIDQSDTPKPNPLADWQQQAANRGGSYPDYHLIRLASVTYPQAQKAADWEFTYDRDGTFVHVLNRNVLANSQHAYALYWSAPVGDWDADYHYFQAFAATFRPAPASSG
jgi:tRNA A-37 threonylcarbamoyl transferase component Bud32